MAVATERQSVRLFLTPLDRTLCAVDFDEDIILATVRNLAGGDSTEPAIFKAYHGVSVVIELPTGLKRLQVARDVGWE